MRTLIDYIYEWARQRSSFKSKIEEKVKIISSHLALIMWARIYDPDNRNINHWKEELIGFCGDLALLKMENNKYSKRKNVFEEVFYKTCEVNTAEGMYAESYKKLREEGITNHQEAMRACERAVVVMINLIDMMARKDVEGIENYIESL